MVINACSNNFNLQIEELNGFATECLGGIEAGNTIVFCRQEQNKDKLAGKIPEKELLFIPLPYYQPESALQVLETLVGKEELYFFSSEISGSELAVRLAARKGGSSIVGARSFKLSGKDMVVTKMVYSNHMLGEFRLQEGPICISLAKGMWQRDSQNHNHNQSKRNESYEIIDFSEQKESPFTTFIEFEKKPDKDGIEDAKLVVIAGRGIGKKEKAEDLETMVNRMHGKLGASRPAVMNAWFPMERLVGVSGMMLGPDVCITAGVSGAAALYAGIEKSKFIVAINSDEKAPIMKKADVAVADDYELIMKALIDRIKEDNV